MSNLSRNTRRERLPALEIDASDSQSLIPPIPLTDAERASSTGSVGSSSLDPYYFSVPDPNSTTTPDPTHELAPITPARDPSTIDRRGLVGVGELATPRWATREGDHGPWTSGPPSDPGDVPDQPVEIADEAQESGPDSPWTIEAIDGDGDEVEVPLPSLADTAAHRVVRSKPSITEESGGEEILYPRQQSIMSLKTHDLPPRAADSQGELSEASASTPVLTTETMNLSLVNPASPPSAFAFQPKAKKRTSDEFLMDHANGVLVSKSTSLKAEPSNTSNSPSTATVRKHRSLGPSSTASASRLKDRRRGASSGTVLDIDVLPATKVQTAVGNTGKHARHSSASASSSSSEVTGRRALNHGHADFSHLPPSPSSSSIQQFLRTIPGPIPTATGTSSAALNTTTPTTQGSTGVATPPTHTSPSVAHSLLRGTQEGWSALDDLETVEALRKLDGLSGKTVHARSSVSLGSKGNSRPGTPGRVTTSTQWEGIDSKDKMKRQSVASTKASDDVKSKRSSAGSGKDREHETHDVAVDTVELSNRSQLHADDSSQLSPVSTTPGRSVRRPGSKDGPTTPRTSFTAKRGSASSATFTSTPTTSSRDSTTFSTSTSATSALSARSSSSKNNRRNSGGSDVSSVHSSDAASMRDRVATLANLGGDTVEDERVPPVPPLPKDFATYKSPQPVQPSIQPLNPSSPSAPPISSTVNSDADRMILGDVTVVLPPKVTPVPPLVAPINQPIRSPSKKWSFSTLNLKRQSSSSNKDLRQAAITSSVVPDRPISFAYTTDTTGYQDSPHSAIPSHPVVDTTKTRPIVDVESLTARSSMSSLRVPTSPASTSPAGFRDRSPSFSSRRTPERPDTSSSVNTHTTGHPPLSPRQPHSNSSRLTPSGTAIPFFRRSSSHSLYQQPQSSSSSTLPSAPNSATNLPATVKSAPSPPPAKQPLNTPLSPTKKSSVFGLSLLKGSSSRRSLQAQADKDKEREEKRERQQEKERERQQKKEDDKDRSESRISVLMGRKRGKTLSSTDQRKSKVVPLPPMQMSAIPPATAQRVANLKSGTSSPTANNTPTVTRTATSSSRLTASTVSSMNKQSDTALRMNRHQLPTIAGSPSTSTNGVQSNQGSVSSQNTLTKETPTKIPRMASRSSTTHSPTGLKSNASMGSRRTSLNLNTYNSHTDGNASSFDEFGVLESDANSKIQATPTTARLAARTSPQSVSRVPRTVASTLSNTALPRKSNRDSISFSGLRKSSTGSVAMPPPAQPEPTSRPNRLSMLSPSKSLKLLSPKLSSTPSRSQTGNTSSSGLFKTTSASSSRQSLSSPSPVPPGVDEEELLGDEEMMAYIKRHQARKLASGAKKEELDDLLKFPEPITPVPAMTPNGVLNGSLGDQLSPYERQEILDYPSVHYVGQGSKKNPATADVTTNNYGYDDERGDYLVIEHDHLAYRYEIIDTLGKGSFGQVLNCRDHATGTSVAIKIIRNKKRFHHQALVEIKILDNLRKWDPEEKYHVIKMTENFYFRNHLCIAMELLSINLYELIKANGFVGFTTNLIRRFTSQMLSSLVLMRQHRIVHCDLKPENVLLRHPVKSGIKVIDFGSSCFEHEKVYTYIQSRFYRSPEVILGMNYHTAIDMWSLGCILAELYTGYPIFPGENEQEQLSCIMEVLGLPDKDLVNRSSRKRLFFDSTGAPRPVVNSKGRRRRPATKTLAQVLRCDDELFVDFVAKCLIWDPERRLKPQPALRHPFLTTPRGRASKGIGSTPSKSLLSSTSLSGGSGSSSSRNTNKVTETPKKSQIGAPTPLTARGIRAPTTTDLSIIKSPFDTLCR
ncbi:hypothetical protein BU17DRAFT_78128 [Hysterangium stoloniferum]|nr:hypothetical protein BU17DRAFT_78128 [Hysterangium stoloniferum]